MKRFHRIWPTLAAGLLVGFASACSPQSKKERSLSRADRDFAAGRYDAAEIEYLNALRIDRLNAHAIGRLGVIYFDQGRVGRSYPCLTEARRLEPDDLEVRLKLGLYLLSLGQYREAGDEAKFILQKNPGSPEAPLLLAEAAVLPDEITDARQILAHLPGAPAASAPTKVAQGVLEIRERHFPAAEKLFRQALALDPKSSDASTGLAALDWAMQRLPEADQAFAQAAALAPDRPAKRVQYAQFKIQTGDRARARAILEETIRQAPSFLPAAVLLAELDEAEKKYGDSAALAAKVLARDPVSPEALLLAGRLKLIEGKTNEAISGLERAVQIYPHFPKAEYELAQAYLAAGATEKARECLNRAVLWDPGLAEAALLLAQVNLQAGDPGAAATVLRPLADRRPDLAAAPYLLAEADAAQNNLEEALALYRKIAASSPADPQPLLAAGQILLRQGRKEEARRSFEQALALGPGALPALQELVRLDLGAGQVEAARRRVDAWMAKNPARPGGFILRAQVCFAQHDRAGAESALQQAIKLRPDTPAAYFLLAGLHSDANDDDRALADLRSIVGGNARDTRALMLIGMIQERKKDFAAARETYGKILAVDPNFSSALNNLAYLDSESPGDLDRALELATRARKLQPDEPRVADTLGWIMYKKHRYEWALTLLQEASARLPDSADVALHLGLTRYMLGDEDAARSALQRALRLGLDPAGTEQARHSLAALAIDGATAGPAEQTWLEKARAAAPDDPIVLSRLAAIYQREGAGDRAIGLLEAAVRANPKRVASLVELARAESAAGHGDRAYELAESAHELAPDDAEAGHLLGLLAYRKGDFPWSVSLLQDAVDRQPDNPDALFDLALAEYSLGRIDDATASTRRALASAARFTRRESARTFLDLVGISDHPSPSARARVDGVLRDDPDNLPALMALGALAEQRQDPPAAREAYEKVLDRDPAFAPAARRLVILEAESPGDDRKAAAVFLKAREAYPSDPLLARAGGIIAYRMGDYRRAVALLQESSGQGGDDGERLFYLGMAQCRLKDSSGRETLRHAVSLNLRPDLAAEARRALAE